MYVMSGIYIFLESPCCPPMIEHALVIATSTLSAARFNNHSKKMTCSGESLCAASDALATVDEALLPILMCFTAFVGMQLNLPSLVGRGRVMQLQDATQKILILFYPTLLVWVQFHKYPAITSIAVRHSVAFLLMGSARDGKVFQKVLALLGLGALGVWIWQEGLPMPIFESPGVSVGCSAMAHLVGILSSRLILPALQWVFARTVIGPT